jgi:hypothetical protein
MARSPFVRSYGMAVADQAVLPLKAAVLERVLVLREAQPKIVVSSFPTAAGRPPTLTDRA